MEDESLKKQIENMADEHEKGVILKVNSLEDELNKLDDKEYRCRLDNLKPNINEFLFQNLHPDATLKEMDNLATDIIDKILKIHDKYDVTK